MSITVRVLTPLLGASLGSQPCMFVHEFAAMRPRLWLRLFCCIQTQVSEHFPFRDPYSLEALLQQCSTFDCILEASCRVVMLCCTFARGLHVCSFNYASTMLFLSFYTQPFHIILSIGGYLSSRSFVILLFVKFSPFPFVRSAIYFSLLWVRITIL